MTERLITHLRHVDLAVPDYARQLDFYTGVVGPDQGRRGLRHHLPRRRGLTRAVRRPAAQGRPTSGST